jgi:hypothetical protein
MTMAFTASPPIVAKTGVGEKVAFDLKLGTSGVRSPTSARANDLAPVRPPGHPPPVAPTGLPEKSAIALFPWKENGAARRGSTATGTLSQDLDRRARHGPIGAKDAAVPGCRPEHGTATRAIVEKLAGVGGHGLGLDRAAFGAGDRRVELGRDVRHNDSPARAARRRPAARPA